VPGLVRQQKRRLTVIANDATAPGKGIGKLISDRQVGRVIASHIGLNPATRQQMPHGDLQVELVPQGTLVEQGKQTVDGGRTDADCPPHRPGTEARHAGQSGHRHPHAGRELPPARPACLLPVPDLTLPVTSLRDLDLTQRIRSQIPVLQARQRLIARSSQQ
jgi:hypothetical protein